jgi:hypothetical protein
LFISRMLKNDRLNPPQPLKVIPFPAAAVRRTQIEEFFGPVRVGSVRRQQAVGQADAAEVRRLLLAFESPGLLL